MDTGDLPAELAVAPHRVWHRSPSTVDRRMHVESTTRAPGNIWQRCCELNAELDPVDVREVVDSRTVDRVSGRPALRVAVQREAPFARAIETGKCGLAV